MHTPERLKHVLSSTEIPYKYLSRAHVIDLRDHLGVDIEDDELRKMLRSSGIEILEPLPLPTSPGTTEYVDFRTTLSILNELTFAQLITGGEGTLWIVDVISFYSPISHQRSRIDSSFLQARQQEYLLSCNPKYKDHVNWLFDSFIKISSDPQALKQLLLFDLVEYAKVSSNPFAVIERAGINDDEARQISFAIDAEQGWQPAWETAQSPHFSQPHQPHRENTQQNKEGRAKPPTSNRWMGHQQKTSPPGKTFPSPPASTSFLPNSPPQPSSTHNPTPTPPPTPHVVSSPAPLADIFVLASWSRRVAAATLDYLFTFLVVGVCGATAEAVFNLTSDQSGDWGAFLFWMLPLLLSAMQGVVGYTPGKRICGILLVDENSATPIGIFRSLRRSLYHLADYAILMLGFLLPLVDNKRQTLADKFEHTVVISSAASK